MKFRNTIAAISAIVTLTIPTIAHAGSWTFTVTPTCSPVYPWNPNPKPVTQTVYENNNPNRTSVYTSYGFSPYVDLTTYKGDATKANGTMTLDITGTFSPDSGESTPSQLVILEQPNVYIFAATSSSTASRLTLTGTLNDYFGDPIVKSSGHPGHSTEYWYNELTSSGSHLTVLPVSGGKVSFSRTFTLTGQCDALDTCNGNVSYTLYWDNRSVIVTSTIDPTYHKEYDASNNPIAVKDVPDSNGTINANSVAASQTISYKLSGIGNWTSGSNYLIHCNSQDPKDGTNAAYTASGGTTSTIINPLVLITVPYGDNSTSEHAYGHIHDSNDNADATNNYYVTFHKVEGWQRLGMIYHPLPTTGPIDTVNTGEWQVLGTYPNSTASTNSHLCSVTASVTDTITGTISFTEGRTTTTHIDGTDIANAFSANESITISQAINKGSTQTFTAQLLPHTMTYVYWGKSTTDRSGVCDIYGPSGYDSTVPWNCHVPSLDGAGNISIAYTTKSYPL